MHAKEQVGGGGRWASIPEPFGWESGAPPTSCGVDYPGPAGVTSYLDGVVGVRDERDEERQHHVDEEGDEGVEVGPAEQPHHGVLVLQLGEGGEHVVAVEQREQTLSHAAQALKLTTEVGGGKREKKRGRKEVEGG